MGKWREGEMGGARKSEGIGASLTHALVWHSFVQARESLVLPGSVPGGSPEKVPRKGMPSLNTALRFGALSMRFKLCNR